MRWCNCLVELWYRYCVPVINVLSKYCSTTVFGTVQKLQVTIISNGLTKDAKQQNMGSTIVNNLFPPNFHEQMFQYKMQFWTIRRLIFNKPVGIAIRNSRQINTLNR